MSFLSPDEVAAGADGRWLTRPASGTALTGVGIDTRGDLQRKVFVAVRGERHDGHDYLPRAVAAGATMLVVHSQPSACVLPEGVGILLVDDTRAALGRLAAAWRQRLSHTRVIAVTGSCGKTTVKKLLDEVLSSTRRGTAAPGSYNNDIGLPTELPATV